MQYTDIEKQIAKDFLDCKIPNVIYNNEIDLHCDTMEYYEALFDFAHCILDEVEMISNFSNSLNYNDFECWAMQQKSNSGQENFYDKAIRMLKIITKYRSKSLN